MPLFKYAKKLNNFYKMSFLIFWKSFPTWKKLFWKSFPTGKRLFFQVFFNLLLQLGRSNFSKSFQTWKKLFFQVFFILLLLLGRSYFSKSFSTWKKLFFQVFFNLLLLLGRCYFWKSFPIWKKLFFQVFNWRSLQVDSISKLRETVMSSCPPPKCSDHSFQHTLTLQLWCACYLTRILMAHP